MRPAIHMPNGPADLERIQKLKVTDVFDLHHFASRWGEVSAWAKVHARIDVRGALDAVSDAQRVGQLVSVAPCATVHIRNEPNIESPANSAQWRQYLYDLGRLSNPNWPLWVPAVSPGKYGWTDWLNASVDGIQARPEVFKGLLAHVYGNPAEIRAGLATIRNVWPGRLIVSEYNFGAGRQYDLQQYARDWPTVQAIAAEFNVEVLSVFIWEWFTPDMALPTTVNVINTPMEQAMAGTLPVEPPHVGEGFNKALSLVGPWLEDEIYHAPGTDRTVSLALGERGYATWSKVTNETTALVYGNPPKVYVDDQGLLSVMRQVR